MEDVKEIKKDKIAIVACSGASNTGQITNEVAKNLCKDAENFTMVCLAALPLGARTAMDKIENAKKIIVVDGCPIKCASQLIGKYTDKKPDIAFQIMEDYGVKKVSDPNAVDLEEVDKITKDVLAKIKNLSN